MKLRQVLNTVRRSLEGENRDYTQGKISEAVILLAIPMILEIGLESVFAIVDMFFVSGLGPNAIATVGLTESVVTLIYSISIGLGTGVTAIVARRVGEKNISKAEYSGAQAILLAIICSLIIGIPGAYFADDILHLMGASDAVVIEGATFARIMYGANLPIILLFLINGIFRGAGNAAMAMRSLWLASGTNILFCPILIHFLGLKGAALATVIGRSTGVAYQSYHLIKGDGRLTLVAKHFKRDLKLMKNIASIAWPATFQFIIGSGSWILITRLVAETGGTAASAGYQIAFRNFVFFILPAWGLSNAAATLVGQNLGAKHLDRAERSVWVTMKFSAVLMLLVTALLVGFAPAIVGVFTKNAEVFHYGVGGLRIISSGFLFYGVSMVLTQALNGAGDTKTPTRINFVSYWLFQTPLAYYLVKHTSLGPAGAMLAIPFANLLLTLLAFYFFKRGDWRKIKV